MLASIQIVVQPAGADAAGRTPAARLSARSALVALLATATLLVLGPTASRASAAPQTRSAATRVTVTMKEFRFVLSKRSVRSGAVTFQLVNRGHLAHDFKIAGKKSALIKPGKTGTLRVVFRRAGSYPYICTVPGHAAAGMKGVLRVTK